MSDGLEYRTEQHNDDDDVITKLQYFGWKDRSIDRLTHRSAQEISKIPNIQRHRSNFQTKNEVCPARRNGQPDESISPSNLNWSMVDGRWSIILDPCPLPLATPTPLSVLLLVSLRERERSGPIHHEVDIFTIQTLKSKNDGRSTVHGVVCGRRSVWISKVPDDSNTQEWHPPPCY